MTKEGSRRILATPFLRSKEAAPGSAARCGMQHNFFLSDPDALTISQQLIEERKIKAPLTLQEAQVFVTLATVAGNTMHPLNFRSNRFTKDAPGNL